MNSSQKKYDAIVVGAGPNGLGAAITLAQEGLSVLLLEAKPTIGGGARTEALTEPGFLHDVCSAVHPMGAASPFLRSLPLAKYGLEFIPPPTMLAHPLDNGNVGLLHRSLPETVAGLGVDGTNYRRFVGPFVENPDAILHDLVGPLRIPKHPLLALGFGIRSLPSAQFWADTLFKTEEAKALWAGLAAHAILPLTQWLSSAVGVMLTAMGHAFGWPIARGGSQSIVNAMARHFESLGGEIVTNTPVRSIKDLPTARLVLFDLTPRQIVEITGLEIPPSYRRQLQNYRYGPGVFKMDWALKEPIPWKSPACAHAGTVHIGGTFAEIARSEQAAWDGVKEEEPFVLLSQPSLFDASRAPAGKHTAWAYCHVPHGSSVDMSSAIEKQVERFAPGFRDCILARHVMGPLQMQQYNANYVGGDIIGGVTDLRQLFARPTLSLNPYTLVKDRYYICSSSTLPGAGVHGLCGYFAAKSALN